jgi:hypothetical protein
VLAVRLRLDKDKNPVKVMRNEPEKKKFKGALISVASKIIIISIIDIFLTSYYVLILLPPSLRLSLLP